MFAALLIALALCAPLEAVALNQTAPAFTLKNSSKQSHSLSDYRGSIVVINFWASWCAPCRTELPELDRLAKNYMHKNVKIVAINVDKDAKAGRELLKRMGLSQSHMEVLLDPTERVVSAYSIDAMPTSYILDTRGRIRFVHNGFREDDPATWRKEIDSLREEPARLKSQ